MAEAYHLDMLLAMEIIITHQKPWTCCFPLLLLTESKISIKTNLLQHMAFPFSWYQLYIDTVHRYFSLLFWTRLTDKMHGHALQSQNSNTVLWGVLHQRSGISDKCSGTRTDQYFPVRLFCPALLWLDASAEGLSSCCIPVAVVDVCQQEYSVEPGQQKEVTI